MGSNYKSAGKDSLDEFITAMFRSEGEQLSAFISFVRSTNLVEAMRKHDWATFAAGYNGPGYALKHYDLKIKANYEAASSRSSPVASK